MAAVRTRFLALCAVLFAAPAVGADEYSFDAGQFEKKSFEFGGYAELRAERFRLSRDAALYQLNFFDQKPIAAFNRGAGVLQLEGLYRRGIGSFRFVGSGSYVDDYSGAERDMRAYEAYLTLAPSDRATYDLGKKTLSWGKGYAFNPVGFVQRMKDPNDPELAREGFMFAGGNFIRSFEGPLKTVAFTPLVIPTGDRMNEDFGPGAHANPAAKLSLLYRDTDIDFLVLGEGARSARYGFDFSRNLGANVEIHGEWARIARASKPVLGAGGSVATQTAGASSTLLGLRHLSERDTTTILEYYYNGAGYTEAQMRDYFTFVHNAHDPFLLTGNSTALERARTLQTSYARANPMRRYLYLRVNQKEPFDILYFTPALTVIGNLDDGSTSFAPELLYTGVTNLELRLRLFFLAGGRLADFGEKQNDRRIELRARYFF
jgi:hypothetical protein